MDLLIALVMGGSPPVDPLEVIDALYVIEATQESAQRGAIVDV